MSIDLSQFHQVFFEESLEGLDVMESALMALDPEQLDAEIINEIFRAAHSIKGGSATFGFSVVSDFTHVLETLLDEVRDDKRGVSQEDVDLYLQSVDCLRDLLETLQAKDEPDPVNANVLKAIFEKKLTDPGSDKNDSVAAINTGQDVSVEENKRWLIQFVPDQNILRTGNEPSRIFRELSGLGKLTIDVRLDNLPNFEKLEPDACYLSWDLVLDTAASLETIQEAFEWVADECEIHYAEQSSAASESRASEELQCWRIKFTPSVDVLRTGNEPARMFRQLADFGDVSCRAMTDNLPDFSELTPGSCFLGWMLELKASSPIARADLDEVFEWVVDESELEISLVSVDALELSQFEPSPLSSGEAPAEINTTPNDIMYDGARPDLLDENTSQADATGDTTDKTLSQQVPIVSAEVASSSTHEEVDGNSADTAPKASDLESTKSSVQKPKASRGANNETGSIRVGIDKIDNLINMVSELVITQSMLGQLGTDFEPSNLPKLQAGLSQLEHNTRELQESVMRVRMLPISFTFSRFPRMVRDLSRRLGKTISLELQGEQTELDKTVMERIGDPLVHLVRNAVDHGIEMPDERKAKGKPTEGTIILNAYHQSGNVVIEIRDDGKGLDKDVIKEKAIGKGLVSENEADLMTDEQVYELIFTPGFSTAVQVSDVSGRGVGMDVVKRNIQDLNGMVEITSQQGIGSIIRIRLPLTLAILDGQLVSVGESTYIFPLVSIVESLQVDKNNIRHVAGGCDVFQLRDEYLPIIHLYEVFNITPKTKDIEDSLLVVVEFENEKVGVVVDDLLSQQQVVIKSLEENYKRIEGVSAATILGDGTVALILDTPGIVNLAGNAFKSSSLFAGEALHETFSMHHA